jgi:hypothetical protein
MQINRNNYESYFLDFLEGRLPELEIDELMAFLKKNPDLEDTLLHFDNYIIESNTDIKLNKGFLFKSLENFHSINENNFDEFCIAWYENDLSPASREELSKYLVSHPDKSRDFENYGKVFVKPDLNKRYAFKSKLKRFTLLTVYKYAYISAAAAAVLLIIFNIFPINKQSIPSNKTSGEIAERKIMPKPQNIVKNSELKSIVRTSSSKKSNYLIPAHLDSELADINTEQNNEGHLEELVNLEAINSIKIIKLNNTISSEKIALTLAQGKMNKADINLLYPGLKEFAIRRLHKNIEPDLSHPEDENSLSLWDIARLGVSGINKLTGSEIKLDLRINDEGKITAMAIESGNLGFSRSLGK